MTGSIDLALETATALHRAGIEEVCLCAGARNSPLIRVLTQLKEFRTYSFFEERSAAFFALGRIKLTGKPVAVVTTSGTAAAELLPAAVEGHYSGLALVLVTADRPRRYRGTGAPQAIEQNGIFGPYVALCEDVEAGEGVTLERWKQHGPAHLNICFDEPLLDRALAKNLKLSDRRVHHAFEAVTTDVTEGRTKLEQFLAPLTRPWVLVGSLESDAREAVCAFLIRLGAPVYLEAQSGLRENAHLAHLRVVGAEPVRDRCDGVLRLGGVPTLRFWRDLEEKYASLPLLSVSSLPFSGTPRAEVITAPLVQVFDAPLQLPKVAEGYVEEVRVASSDFGAGLDALLGQYPRSEPGLFRGLSEHIHEGARVFLGNSLPIREWDLAATFAYRHLTVGASRGANGIDGQISTFLGFASDACENWGIFGDLTTMYDLSAPWVLPQLQAQHAQIVVINNGGGKIFSRIFAHAAFENRHAMDLEPWAKLWGVSYEKWDRIPAVVSGPDRRIIELRPDEAETQAFWDAWDQLCKRG